MTFWSLEYLRRQIVTQTRDNSDPREQIYQYGFFDTPEIYFRKAITCKFQDCTIFRTGNIPREVSLSETLWHCGSSLSNGKRRQSPN